MLSLIKRPSVAPTPRGTIRLTDKQTIAANLRLESLIHETYPYSPGRDIRDVNEQLTILKSSPDVVNFCDIASHPWGH